MTASNKRKRSEAGLGAPDGRLSLSIDNDLQPQTDSLKKVNTACKACRKQKIKCELNEDQPPCSRCRRRGLECILHTPSRTAAEDHRQIGLLGKDVLSMHGMLERICQRLEIDPPDALRSHREALNDGGQTASHDYDPDDEGVCELSPPVSPSVVKAPIDSYLTGVQETSPYAQSGPAQSSPHKARRNTFGTADMITKGKISLDSAEALVHYYLTHLDPFLYSIASSYKGIEDVRRASPALLAAMCTVSAFQKAENRDLFDICNREYRQLVSTALFEKRDVEHIRALCVGSFWLPNASRILNGDAIRRSADCRLHCHFHELAEHTTAPSTAATPVVNDKAADRVRLWYLLFVCDQQISILHNRDCVMHPENDVIEGRESLLATNKPSNENVRLVSQVSLLVIMGQIRDVFGSEQPRPVPKALSVQLAHFTRELDQWFARFHPIFEADPNIGNFPSAGLSLHNQFGRLYLGHHILRGLQKSDPIPLHFQQAALAAREAAAKIFSMIIENEALRANVVGIPHYFHIMISFAGHFLLEACMKYSEQLSVSVEDEFRRIAAVLALFSSTDVVPQHPLGRVTTGLMRKLSECAAALGFESVLTGSPFECLEGYLATARDFGTRSVADGAVDGLVPAATPFDWQGMPSDFLYTDFADFNFADPHFDFMT